MRWPGCRCSRAACVGTRAAYSKRAATPGANTLCRAAQDPGEAGDFADDPATAALLSLLECDKHKDVRKAVVSSVAISDVTLPALVERTRDCADDVRRTAFLMLASKVPLASLSIAARATVLRRGLCDRAPPVRAAAVVMLGKWMEGAGPHSACGCTPAQHPSLIRC